MVIIFSENELLSINLKNHMVNLKKKEILKAILKTLAIRGNRTLLFKKFIRYYCKWILKQINTAKPVWKSYIK